MSGEPLVKSYPVLLRIDEETLRKRARELEDDKNNAVTRDVNTEDCPREKRKDDEAIVAELVSSRLGMRREPCASCGHPVFLAEKLVVARNAYHRSCFRCARCQHQLTPGNYYETEDGQYCCEACPTDENPNDDDDDDDDDKDDGELIDPSHRELTHSPTQHHHQQQQHHHHHHHHHHHQHHQQRQKQPNASSTPSKKLYSDAKEDDAAVLEAPLSDEEKSKRRSLDRSSSMDRLLRNQRTKLDIMTSHLLGADTSNLDNDKNNDQLDATNDSVVPLTSESDEEKSARSLLLRRDNPVEAEETKEPKKSPLPDVMLPEVDDDDNNDEKFDLMIKLINERIDELITEERTDDKQQRKPIEGEEEKREVSTTKRENEEEREIKPEEIKEKEDVANKTVESSPNATRRYSRDEAPGATATVQLRRASVDGEEPTRRRRRIEQEEQAPATLRRCSSLRSAGEYTKEDRGTSGPEPRRMSLVQRRLRLFESNEPSASLETSRRQQQQQQQQQEPSAQPQRDANEDKQRQPEPRSSLVDNLAKPLPEEKKENTARKTTPSKLETYPEYLNPFASDDDDDDDEDEEPAKAKEKDRQRLSPKKKETSTNPFGSDEEETETVPTTPPPKPAVRTRSGRGATLPQEASKKRVIEAPRINLNPFWSDGEEPESEPESETELRNKSPPVPKPRTFRHSHMEGSFQPKSNLTSSSIYSSNTSIASSCSTITPGGTYRKKKPAPPPPILNQSLTTPHKSHNTSTNSNPSLSPRLTPRTRKTKPAPPPPLPAAASTPTQHSNGSNGNVLNGTNPLLPDGSNGTPDNDARKRTETPVSPPPPPPPALQQQQHQQQSQPPQHLWDDEKLSKDEANRTTQSLSCMDNSSYSSYAHDKSVEGKWKRKKGPAPPRPIPLRRKIKVMSMKDVKLELDQIEMQQQGLEKQGVRLEQIIRDKCESGTTSEDTSLGLDVEELVLELFALVNEKNELFRRQAELMLLRRQQRLEEEYADIEYQVRCLITQPEATKTDFDKQREETLIQRLVEIVERRNEIVECLEMDRRREIEEDRSIHREMDLYAARNKADNVNMTDESRRSSKLKKGKVKEKTKEKKSKKNNKKDADKDVDETETKLKRHSLRKWF